jgi:transcriptional regulator with XRE-family HTH domain
MREWLKHLREAAELSQDEVAKQAGISQSYYAAIETGERGDKLPVPTAKKIADVLRFDWQQFYSE